MSPKKSKNEKHFPLNFNLKYTTSSILSRSIWKKDLNYNNYDNKYYNKGVPFSGKIKVMIEANKGYYIITYKDGVVNGKIIGYINNIFISFRTC